MKNSKIFFETEILKFLFHGCIVVLLFAMYIYYQMVNKV